MAVRIQVVNTDMKPIFGVEVFVSWKKGGHARGQTDIDGIANLGGSLGVANYIRINGHEVKGVTDLPDGITTISYR